MDGLQVSCDTLQEQIDELELTKEHVMVQREAWQSLEMEL